MCEKQGEVISAGTFLEMLQGDTGPVVLINCVIEGVVDIFSTGLERDAHNRILLKKSLTCIGCTFRNIVNFRAVVFQQEVDFRRTLFEGILDLDEAVLYGTCAFREAIFQRRADFHSAIFRRSASFWRARFNDIADFHGVQFRENAVFHEADFHNEVNFRRVLFQGTLDCTGTLFPEVTTFNKATFLGTANFTGAQFMSVAAFRDVHYVSNTLFQAVKARLSREPHQPTQFYLDSRQIDEVENPFFKRYVTDQQFIRAFNQGNPGLARLWRWSSDYGRSLGLWALWSFFLAVLFAIAYMPVPEWMPTWIQSWAPRFRQTTGFYSGRTLTFSDCFYFSVVTFTTLGFGDVVADNATARFLVALEVIFGYVMLGGLISIFSNKLASRS